MKISRVITITLVASMIAALIVALVALAEAADASPAGASEAKAECIPDTQTAEDDFAYYWGGRWIHADGNVWGWAAAEDSTIYSTPECAGLDLVDVLRPSRVRGLRIA